MNLDAKVLVVSFALAILAGCAAKEPSTSAATASQGPGPIPNTIAGIAIATDGDTILINGQNIDLWGIEAPNLDNSDGWFSRAALDDFIGENGQLVCIIKMKRWNQRDSAICSNSKVGDVGRAMLQNGWAIVNRLDRKSQDADIALAGVYHRTEKRARESRTGLWANFLPPRDNWKYTGSGQ